MTRHFKCGMLYTTYTTWRQDMNACVRVCVCFIYVLSMSVLPLRTHTHTHRSPTLQEVSIWASYFLLCSPLPLRNGSGALMRTRRSVSLCNTSWNHGQRRAKEKSTKRVCCFIRAVANFHIAFFFAVCVFFMLHCFELLRSFLAKKLNNSNIDWLRQQLVAATTTTKRKSLNSRSFWAQVVALRNLLLLLGNKKSRTQRDIRVCI